MDAAQRGIQEGQDLRVFNERGEFQVKAVITERIRPGVVMAYSIWWKKMGRDGKNCNEVASQALTDLGMQRRFMIVWWKLPKSRVAYYPVIFFIPNNLSMLY